MVLVSHLVSGIGVTPPRIIADDVLKGSTVEQSVRLVDVREGDIVTVKLSGDGSSWVTVDKGSKFTVVNPAGEQIVFTLQIPPEAPNGDYKVTAQMTVEPGSSKKASGSNTASVISGIIVEISFTVTGDEIKKYAIRSVQIPDIESDMPLAIVANIKNDGNVIAKPSSVAVVIRDKETKEVLYEKAALFSVGVDPFVTGTSVALLPIKLAEDLYFADIKMFDGDTEIFSKDGIPFNILPRGALDASAKLTELSVQEEVREIAKITTMLANTGKGAIHAITHIEVYHQGKLVDTLKSQEQYIPKGESAQAITYYTPKKSGEHQLKAYATFSTKQTNVLEASFLSTSGGGSLSNTTLIIAVILLLLIGLALQLIIIKRNKRTNGYEIVRPLKRQHW